MAGTVYLLHFAEPIGNPDKPHGTAQHYIGWSSAPAKRLAAHSAGNGAAIMRAVSAQGVDFQIARTWSGTRALERQLKQRKHASRFCPICKANGQAAPRPGR